MFILGAVIGTVVCSMFNIEEPTGYQDSRDDNSRFTPYPRPSNTNRNNENKTNKSKSTKLYSKHHWFLL